MFQFHKENRGGPKYILLTSPTNATSKLYKSTKNISLHTKLNKTEESSLSQLNCRLPLRSDAFKSPQIHEELNQIGKEGVGSLKLIRSNLNECISNIVLEEKKNIVLKDLTKLLQQQIHKIHENQKQVTQLHREQAVKRARKIEYDIEQILQKYNQQIARIHSLTEHVASARSDRVVFSNLFKKIEKEIKYSQQQYKVLIAKSEMSREEKQEVKGVLTDQIQSVDEIEQREDLPHSTKSPNNLKNHIAASRLFVTNPQSLGKKNSHRGPSGQPTVEDLEYLIEQMDIKTKKIIKVAECCTFEEAVKHQQGIDEENMRLTELIGEEDRKIEQAEAEIDRIRQQKRISQVFETRQLAKLQSLPSLRKIRSFKSLKGGQNELEDAQNMQIMGEIMQALGMGGRENISQEQFLTILQNQIDSLFNPKTFKKSDSNFTISSGSEAGLESILCKMERFDSCQRILSREQLCSEYNRELGKNRRIKNKK